MLLHCFLALSPSYSFTYTNTHTAHTSASGCSDPLGGLGRELVNFGWTHHGNDFPLASLLFQAANTHCFKRNTSKAGPWRTCLTSSTALLVGHISILKCLSNLCQNIEVLEVYHCTVSYLSLEAEHTYCCPMLNINAGVGLCNKMWVCATRLRQWWCNTMLFRNALPSAPWLSINMVWIDNSECAWWLKICLWCVLHWPPAWTCPLESVCQRSNLCQVCSRMSQTFTWI